MYLSPFKMYTFLHYNTSCVHRVPSPSDSAVRKAITKEELARHCKRRTRGAQETSKLIEDLLLSFSSATDTLGVPLLKPETKDI